MGTQKEAEIEILKFVGCSEEEIPQILQEVDNWDFSKKKYLTELVPYIQGEKPDFKNRNALLLFLQLLRQMSLARQCISKFTNKINQTKIYNTLDRRPDTRKYWDCPEFLNKTNEWGYLNTKLTPNDIFNSAFKKIYYPFLWYIQGEYEQNISRFSSHEEGKTMKNSSQQALTLAKNIILYGAPGTGKTYQTVQYAVAIVENKPLEEIAAEDYSEVLARYRKYKDEGRICFTTFHQSYEYEEFIEGLRPRLAEEDGTKAEEDGTKAGGLSYEIHPGVFKRFCKAADTMAVTEQAKVPELAANPDVWKISLAGAGDNPIRRECLDNGHIRIGWDYYGPDPFDQGDGPDKGSKALNAFYKKMKVGDIVLSCYSNRLVDAVGVVTSDPEWHEEFDEYKRLRKVRWLAKDIRKDIYHLNGDKELQPLTVHGVSVSVADILVMADIGSDAVRLVQQPKQNFVFIIDEINRGNMAKIFGELITLIEESKRLGAKEEMRARLPYSDDKYFGVPDNVYIIGTMNTADRSIALMDVALRRRFSFREITPKPELLKGTEVAGIHIDALLDLLNRRIEALLDREHVLGHSAFLPLRETPDLKLLAGIMENNVLPLLQEYFYDDYAKIQLVLGDNQKTEPGDVKFIAETDDSRELFGDTHDDAVSPRYSINIKAFANPLAYKYLGLKNGTGDGEPQSEAGKDDAH